MKLRILLLLTQCICFKTNCGEDNIQSSCEETVKADFFREASFSDPQHLKTNSPRKIHIGASMRIIKDNNDNNTRDFDDGFKHSVKVLFQSLLRLSTGASQHWIILTDASALVSANDLLRNVITEHLTRNLVLTYLGRSKVRRVPSVIIDYIDLDGIVREEKHADFVKALKAWAAPWIMQGTNKYLNDLFYVGPLYHQIFTNLEKLIFLDVDLEFYRDVKLLYKQFAQFDSSQLIGVGLDLSPHYRTSLELYRKQNPGTHIGQPGRYQGLNTGVVLYNLARMRESEEWQNYLDKENVAKLMFNYGFHVTVGDQDWFTNVSFNSSELVYILPCEFNTQVSVQYWRPPWEDIFWDYHQCDRPYVIIHRNGCGPERKFCDQALKEGGLLNS